MTAGAVRPFLSSIIASIVGTRSGDSMLKFADCGQLFFPGARMVAKTAMCAAFCTAVSPACLHRHSSSFTSVPVVAELVMIGVTADVMFLL